MRHLYLLILPLLLAQCGENNPPEITNDSTPVNETSSDSETGKNETINEISVDNAASITAFENTPESVVQYFFASRIRQDKEWEKVCVPETERTSKFSNALSEYETWIFHEYRFVKKEEFAADKWWVTIYMKIAAGDDIDDGEDEVTVEKINGTYLITEVPI